MSAAELPVGTYPATAREAVTWERDPDGIVTLVLDDPTQRVNTMNEVFTRSFARAQDRLEAQCASLTGVIIRSAKRSFFAGADLHRLIQVDASNRAEFEAGMRQRKARFRRLETLGLPVVAVIDGAALGGGLEFALCCNRRVMVDRRGVVVGLPEITLGLVPGGGGVVRTARLLGLRTAFDVLMGGARLDAPAAAAIGLVDEVCPSTDAALDAARKWLLAGPDPWQPWDRPGATHTGATDTGAADTGADDAAVTAWAVAALDGRADRLDPASPDTAPRTIMRLATTCLAQPIDQALETETAGFLDVLCTSAARATLSVAFFDTQRLTGADRRSPDLPRRRAPLVIVTEGPPSPLVAALGANSPACTYVDLSALEPDEARETWVSALTRGDVIAWCGDSDAPVLRAAEVGAITMEPAGAVCVIMPAGVAPGAEFPPTVVPVWLGRDRSTPGLVAEVGRLPDRRVRQSQLVADTFRAAGVQVIDVLDRPFGDAVRDSPELATGALAAAAAASSITPVAKRLCEVGAAALAWPEDLDVASVRSGGLPAWTGGARRWLQAADGLIQEGGTQ